MATDRNRTSTPRNTFEPPAWSRVYSDTAPSPSQQLFRRVMEEVSAAAAPFRRRGQLWLDLGCGTGELAGCLADGNIALYGIDHDPEMLRWADRSTEAGVFSGFIAADVGGLPFAARSISGVVTASLTGCLRDLEALLLEISRVLSHGGHAVLSFTNADSFLLAASGRLRRRSTRGNANHPCHGTFHRYRIDEVIDSASCHGLELVATRHFNCFIDLESCSVPPEKVARLIERIRSRWITRRLCRNFVVVLRSASDVSVSPGG